MNSKELQVVITDWTFPDLSIEEEILRAGGVKLTAKQCKTESELGSLCAEADAVIVQFARINPAVIQLMKRAKAIVRYGIGVDNVDLEAARLRGIPVCNVPDYCIDEVADQTMAFILALTRQVVVHTDHLRRGSWGLAVPLAGMRALRDMQIGVVGYGRIGREVVNRLIPFKCRVLVHDPMVSASQITASGAKPVGWGELLAEADLLTLHCPSNIHTRRLVNRDALSQMKQGALLVNVGRGDLVDPDALTSALASGHLGGAALDVFDPEPIPSGHPVLSMSSVLLAPHLASCSVPAVKKLRESAANLALAAVKQQPLPTVVNGVSR